MGTCSSQNAILKLLAPIHLVSIDSSKRLTYSWLRKVLYSTAVDEFLLIYKCFPSIYMCFSYLHSHFARKAGLKAKNVGPSPDRGLRLCYCFLTGINTE